MQIRYVCRTYNYCKKVITTKLTTSKLKEKRKIVSTVSSKTTNKTNKTKGQVSTKFVPKQKSTQNQINGSKTKFTKKTGHKSGMKFSGSNFKFCENHKI